MDIERLSWSVHPAKEEKLAKSILLVVLIALSSIGLGISLNFYHGFAGFILLLFSLSKYFFKTVYFVDMKGAGFRFLFFSSHKDWNYYTRYCINIDGIFLSPFNEISRLDSFKGLFLKFGNSVDRDAVIHTVKKYLDH